jgi:hypothetical protein
LSFAQIKINRGIKERVVFVVFVISLADKHFSLIIEGKKEKKRTLVE